MPAPPNTPGARGGAAVATDAAGNLWLFGGGSYRNDLWQYSGGNWAWMSGSMTPDQSGVYGTQGVADSADSPGSRSGATIWFDVSGSLWLFGGYGLDSGTGFAGSLNDLWTYSAGRWTWVSGPTFVNDPGSYGSQGVASPTNNPSSRTGATSWTDTAGNVWLFGGSGYGDVWKYSAGEWTWVSGPSVPYEAGNYGAQGTAAPANNPGGRLFSVGWTDAAGNFWLFGGYGYDSTGTRGDLNDLWKYSAGQWTWIGGSSQVGQSGTYGTQGSPSASNVPGARDSAVSWTDSSGNLWLFGGQLQNSSDDYDFNDLWKFSAGQWTWVSGSNTPDQPANYGSEGVAASANVPGARDGAIAWTDKSGNFWLYGGYGLNSSLPRGSLDDIWEFQPQ